MASIDAVSQGVINGATSQTISHTVGSNSNRVLYVISVCLNSTDLLATGTCEYGGVDLGAAIASRSISGNQHMYAWRQIAPTSGTANVLITPSASAFLHTFVFSLDTVDQITPNGTIVSSGNGSQTTPVSNAVTVLSGGMAIDMISDKATGITLTPGGTQTQAGTTQSAGVSSSAASYLTDATAMSWSFTSSPEPVIHLVVPVNPASSGYTLTAEVGSYAISGQTAGLLAIRTLTAEVGSYTLTGQEAALVFEQPGVYILAAGTGSYLITGVDALRILAMNAEVGAYSITGQEADLVITYPQAYTLTAERGLYNLTGRAARLIWSGAPPSQGNGTGLSMSMRIGI